ncbi:MAG: tetratricopeptide repeat protein [Acidimicrobiales bacterium]|nr:hypothetical protein [Hyphomonadaceae bacterium]RZV45094.1 MAG: tetratricopeptide repeat protein [Acidimicrobiales bacterium]
MNQISEADKEQRLDSWKRIARHFNRAERTVRRWELNENLPVHRLQHGSASSVYAFTCELDTWLAARSTAPKPSQPSDDLNAKATEFYQKGLLQLDQVNTVALQKAVDDFNQVIRIQPDSVLAYARKAEALQLLCVFGARKPNDAMPEALETISIALAHAPDNAEVNAALGMIMTCYSYDWPAAGRAFDRAITYNPSLWSAHQWQGEYLAVIGRFSEADAAIERARVLSPSSFSIAGSKAYILWLSRRHSELIDEMNDLLSRNPHFPLAYINLGLAQSGLGDFESAIETFAEGVNRTDGSPDLLALRGYAYAQGGHTKKAHEALGELRKIFGNEGCGAFHMAMVNIGLRQYGQAISQLESAYEQRVWQLNMLGHGTFFDPLRQSKRFKELLEKIGLANCAISPNTFSK